MRGYIAVTLVLACAAQAHAIDPYKAQEIQPYRASEIQPYRAAEIQPRRASDIQPYQANEVVPDRAKPSDSYQATEPKPYSAEEVKPRPSGAVSQRNPSQAPAPARQAQGLPAPVKQQKPNLQAVVGIWQTNIPGAVYTTPSGIAGYDTLQVSSGAAAGLLRINADGTYSWNSYGGKKGKWVKTGEAEYPVEILDTVENRRWKVGYSSAKKTLIIWSGSFWYEGRKADVKK